MSRHLHLRTGSQLLLFAASAWALAACKGYDGWTGAAGAPGSIGKPGDGAVCWDHDNNGQCGPAEDVDHSGACDVGDCAGGPGPTGAAGAVGPAGAAGPMGPSPAGPDGPAGPIGLVGLRGPNGLNGPQGPAGAAGATGPVGPRITMTAEYELDEAAGAQVFADISGLNNPLRAQVGGAVAGSGVSHSGLSVAFSGFSGLYVPSPNQIPDSAEIWSEMWIRTNDPNRTYTLLEKEGAYKLRMVAGQLQFTVSTAGGNCTVSSTSIIAADTWTLVSGWYDGLRVSVAFDHIPQSSACAKGRLISTLGNQLAIGGKFLGDSWIEGFRGNIDEVRIRPIAPYVEAEGGALEHPVWRYTTFHTYNDNSGWWWNNNSGMESLGVQPSSWTDGDAQVDQISSDKDWLRSVLTSRGSGGKNAAVIQDNPVYQGSTDGPVTIAMFRIKNTTSQSINWTPQFAITYYASYNERASVALNGQLVWSSAGLDCNQWACQHSAPMSIPAGRTSNVLFAATGGQPTACPYCQSYRSNVLVINHDSAVLPAGLSYVDDFDTMTGDWSN